LAYDEIVAKLKGKSFSEYRKFLQMAVAALNTDLNV
jgi:hypothetical protein